MHVLLLGRLKYQSRDSGKCNLSLVIDTISVKKDIFISREFPQDVGLCWLCWLYIVLLGTCVNVSIKWWRFTIFTMKIRLFWDPLIFIMGMLPNKTVFILRRAPGFPCVFVVQPTPAASTPNTRGQCYASCPEMLIHCLLGRYLYPG